MDSCFLISFSFPKLEQFLAVYFLQHFYVASSFWMKHTNMEAEHVGAGDASQIIQADSGRSVLRFSFIKGTGFSLKVYSVGRREWAGSFLCTPKSPNLVQPPKGRWPMEVPMETLISEFRCAHTLFLLSKCISFLSPASEPMWRNVWPLVFTSLLRGSR